MKPERIKSLIDLMAESDLSELSLSEGDTQLRLLREQGQNSVSRSSLPTSQAASTVVPPQPVVEAVGGGYEAKASLYGVLHLTPAPDQPPFVTLGSQVEIGQTLAVLEAMKMFHPVKAEAAGEVTAILAAAGEEVQAGQALIRIG